MDTSTDKTGRNFYKTTLPSDMIFTKADAYASDEQVEKLTRGFNIHYRYCIRSLIYLLSTWVDLSFAVQKLAKISSNPGKINFDGLVHLLRYIRQNKTLGLNYYADLKYSPLSELLRQAIIRTCNQLMAFSNSSWQCFTVTGRRTSSYIIFYQGGKIDYVKNVPGKFSQSSVEGEYNAACTEGMALSNFMMLIHKL